MAAIVTTSSSIVGEKKQLLDRNTACKEKKEGNIAIKRTGMQTSFVQLAVYEMAVHWLAGSYSSETEPRRLLVETTRPFPHPPPPPSLLGQGDAVESKASLAEFWQREKKRRVGCQANFSVVPPPCAVNLSRIPWLLGIEFLPFSHPWRQESLVSTQSPPTFQASSVGEPSQCG